MSRARARRTQSCSERSRDFPSYQLYKDGGHTQPWGDAGSEVLNAGLSPSRQPRSFAVHGQVPAGQNVPSGTYADTIVVSVNF